MLKEVTEDPQVNQRSLPSRLQIIAQRLAQQGWADKGVLAVTDPEIPKSRNPKTVRPHRLRIPKQVQSLILTTPFGIRRQTVLYVK